MWMGPLSNACAGQATGQLVVIHTAISPFNGSYLNQAISLSVTLLSVHLAEEVCFFFFCTFLNCA